MDKIKILYTGLSHNIGGIETYIYNLYKNIDKEKFEISMLAFKNEKIAFEDEYKKNHVKIYRIEKRTKNYFKYLKDLKQLFKNNSFDYIHNNIMSYSAFEIIKYACKYSEAKVIVHSHAAGFQANSSQHKTIFLDKIGRKALKKYQNKILKFSCGDKAGKFAFGKEKFYILNNGIEFDKFVYNEKIRHEMRNSFKIKDSCVLFLLVGRFCEEKNHEFLIDVFFEYHKLNPNSKLFLVGEGPLKINIQDKINDLNIQNDVCFLGKREDIGNILSMCDVFVMPSIREGFGIALIEAQVNGMKCFASTSLEKSTDITGNVVYIPLDMTAREWADTIINNSIDRDKNVINKLPNSYNSKESCNKVYQLYEENLK